MMNRRDVISKLARQRSSLAKEYGVKSLALFGSVARDEATDDSDVDLLVEFDRPIGLFHLFRVQHRLESLLGVHRVDLLMPDAIHPALRDRILRERIAIG